MRYLRLTGMLAAVAFAACAVDEAQVGDGPPIEPVAGVPTVVAFEDPELETCVRETMGIFDRDILPEVAAQLQILSCPDRQITDIAGLESFTGLLELSLWENEIADITPLSGLVNLLHLQLGNNAIADLWPLAELTNVQRLGLSINFIWDLAPLAGLLELRWLNLDVNQVADIAPIAGLPYLQWLTVDHNPIGQHPAVAELKGRGVVVYADYAGEPQADQYTRPDIRSAAPGLELSRTGRLTADARDDGVLELSFEAGDRRYDVIPEFGGSLYVADGLVHYRTIRRNVVVGAMGDSGPEICTGAYAHVCSLSIGAKAASTARSPLARTSEPVFTAALTLTETAGRYLLPESEVVKPMDENLPPGAGGGVDPAMNSDLVPFVLASPNQLDAGTCLFMSTTGVMELLMNQHTQFEAIQYDGDTDLSERYLMNASDFINNNDMRWVLTDLAYTYNIHGGSMLDRDYPFEMGCINEQEYVVDCNDPDAKYLTTYVNWNNDLPPNWQEMLEPTPLAERTVIFADPQRDENSYWRVALMDDSVIEKIKYELRTKKAPIIIVYNHFLYWHANIIVGYDDTLETGGCPMVDQSVSYYKQQGASSYATKIENHMAANGGCWNQGVFLVRDSIYDGGAEEPTYTYGGYPHTEKYSKRIKELTYNWVRYLANHAYTVHRR